MNAILAQLVVVTCLHGAAGDVCKTIRYQEPMPVAQCQVYETKNDKGDYAASVCVLVGKDA
jgi:hypothetical protein